MLSIDLTILSSTKTEKEFEFSEIELLCLIDIVRPMEGMSVKRDDYVNTYNPYHVPMVHSTRAVNWLSNVASVE